MSKDKVIFGRDSNNLDAIEKKILEMINSGDNNRKGSIYFGERNVSFKDKVSNNDDNAIVSVKKDNNIKKIEEKIAQMLEDSCHNASSVKEAIYFGERNVSFSKKENVDSVKENSLEREVSRLKGSKIRNRKNIEELKDDVSVDKVEDAIKMEDTRVSNDSGSLINFSLILVILLLVILGLVLGILMLVF